MDNLLQAALFIWTLCIAAYCVYSYYSTKSRPTLRVFYFTYIEVPRPEDLSDKDASEPESGHGLFSALRRHKENQPEYIEVLHLELVDGWYCFDGEWAFTYEWKLLLPSFVTTFLVCAPQFIITAVGLFALCAAAYHDWQDYGVPEQWTLLVLLSGIALGIKNGRITLVIVAVLLVCLFDIFLHDSNIFGGADMLVLLGLLCYLGFCAWDICLLISCIAGLIIKVMLWIVRKHKTGNHDVAFLPPILIGAITAKLIDLRWGYLYSITLKELFAVFF